MRARKGRLVWAGAVAGFAVAAVVGTAIATNGGSGVRGNLNGYQETPMSISTTGHGSFKAKIVNGGQAIDWTLSYEGLEAPVLQAHIHFGQRRTSGGISAFLCTNLNGPTTDDCPTPSGRVSGRITAEDVIGPTSQGIEPGALGELVRAIRSGVAYANVHTSKWPTGEIRGQLRSNKDR